MFLPCYFYKIITSLELDTYMCLFSKSGGCRLVSSDCFLSNESPQSLELFDPG